MLLYRTAQLIASALLALGGAMSGAFALPPPADMILVPAGNYVPLIRSKNDPEKIPVTAFLLDARPVTNADFLAFVRTHPQWQRSRVSPLFADSSYLAHWAGDLELGPSAPPDSPVVRITWFAARAYATERGARLPTTSEWELAASHGFTTADAANEPAMQAHLSAWLARPTPEILPAVGQQRPNRLGLHDLHGLAWEWVDDFNTALVTGESRGDAGLERNLFCGAGSLDARDKADYPAFMRSALRSSLRATYAVPNLTFRCARDLAPQPSTP